MPGPQVVIEITSTGADRVQAQIQRLQAAASTGGQSQQRLAAGLTSVEKAASANAASLDKAARALTSLESSLGGAYRAHAQLIQAEERLDQAVRAGLVSTQREIELRKAMTTTFTANAVASRDLRTNMAGMRAAMRNSAQQIQDLAIVASMGGASLGMMAIQVGQLASAFPGMGTAIGTVITLVGVAAGALIAFGSDSETAKDAADSLTDSFARQSDSISDLIDRYRDVSAEQKLTQFAAVQEGGRAAAGEMAKLDAQLETLLGTLTKYRGPQAELAQQFQAGALSLGQFVNELQRLGEATGQAGIPELASQAAAIAAGLDEQRAKMDAAAKAADVLSGRHDQWEKNERRLMTTIKESLGLMEEVRRDRRQAGDAAQRAGEAAQREAERRASGIAALQQEVEGLRLLHGAYGQNADAVRDAEVALEAAAKARELDVAAGTKEYAVIQQLIAARHAEKAAIDVQEKITKQLARARQVLETRSDRNAKAQAEFTGELKDQLSLQEMLLRGVDRESEQYRLQERLMAAKGRQATDLTKEQVALLSQLEKQATAIDIQADLQERLEEPFNTAFENIQNMSTDTWEQVYSGGIDSFSDLAEQVKDIFIRMAAELTTLMIFRPVLQAQAAGTLFSGLGGAAAGAGGAAGTGGAAIIPAMAPAAGAAGVAGWRQGLSGGQAAFGQAPRVAGWTTGLIGGMPAYQPRSWWMTPQRGLGSLMLAGGLGFAGGSMLGGFTGSSTGGGIGGALGAAAGLAVPFGGPALALAGGIGGGLLGGLVGGLFGGGPSGRQQQPRGALGGIAGTGKAAAFVRTLDDRLVELMDARQEMLIDAALRQAPGVQVKFQEDLSPGDMSRLAAGRLGPAATALGFNAAAVTGAPGQLAPEQQFANLQEAISVLDQIEKFRIGPIADQFRTLEKQFDQLRSTAEKYGISLEGVAEAQARETAALERRLRAEASSLMLAVGAADPLTAALQQLKIQFEEATARAEEFGISTANAGREMQLQANILVQQDRLQRHAVMQQVGLITEFDRAVLDLNANMQIAWQEAERLGISTAKLSKEYQRQVNILIQQSRLQQHAIMQQVGLISEFDRAILDLNANMEIARQEAERLGISTAKLGREYQLQVNIIQQQERIHRTEVMLSVGAISELDAALENLNAQFQIAWQEAERLGISTANVHQAFKLAAEELVQNDRLRRHANLEMIGAWTPLGRAVADLDVQFDLARIEAERLGYSTEKLARQQKLAENELIQQFRFRAHANLEEIGLWTPLERALGDLDVKMELARIEAERLGYSTANVAREQKRLANEIIKAHEAQVDAMARSIRDPFKQLAEPLREFQMELEFALLNPKNQAQQAQDEFRRIAARARTGDTKALQQLEQAGQFYIEQMGRFGASPAQTAAIKEVATVVSNALDDIEKARTQAEKGLENEIRLASQREVDTLKELISEVRLVGEEIKRLRR